MNTLNTQFQLVVLDEHKNRLKRAERARLIKELRSNDGTAPSARTRFGLLLMRTGARIIPGREAQCELRALEERIA